MSSPSSMCDTTTGLSFLSPRPPGPDPVGKSFLESRSLPLHPGHVGPGSVAVSPGVCGPGIRVVPGSRLTTISCLAAECEPPDDPPLDDLTEASTVGKGKLTITGGAEKEAGSIPVAIKGTRTSMAMITNSTANAVTMDQPRRLLGQDDGSSSVS